MIKRSHKYYLSAILLLLMSICGFAQEKAVQNPEYGADKTLKSNARINPSTLAMELSIPLLGYAGRGGDGLPLVLNYSSKVWEMKHFAMWNSGSTNWDTEIVVTPLYAKRSAGGWTSTLSSPRIDFEFDLYTDSVRDPISQDTLYEEGQNYKPAPWQEPEDPISLYRVKRLQVIMADGSTHELRADDVPVYCGTTDTGCSPDQSGTYLSVDGSRLRLVVTGSGNTLYLPNGDRYLFANGDEIHAHTFIDRNGNKRTFNSSTGTWADNMGRTIANPFPENWEGDQLQTEGVQTKSFVGFDGDPYSVDFTWRYLKDPNDVESALDDPYDTLNQTANWYCQAGSHTVVTGPSLFNDQDLTTKICSAESATEPPPFNPIVLHKITLPNGQEYKFTYNVFGEVVRIVYPSGAYERFEYGTVTPLQATSMPYDEANRGVRKRWISEKGDGSDEVDWEYDITPSTYSTPYKVTTTAPDGTYTVQSIHSIPTSSILVPNPFGYDKRMSGRPFEDASYSPTHQLLRRSLTKYDQTETLTGITSSDIVAPRDIRPVRQISIVFEPGSSYALAAMTKTVYDTSGSSDPAYFSSLNPKQQKTYDYVVVSASTAATADIAAAEGWFSSATPKTVTEIDYLYDANYKARNITGLVTETRVKDAAGNVKAKSQIFYDEVGSYPIISAGTHAQWENPGTNYRGNVTTTKSWYDIANNLSIQTHAQYDNFGNLRKAWDGNGNLTQTDYSSTYAYAYPTSVTTPVPDTTGTHGSSTAFTSSTVYDLNTGLPTSVTDANGAVTKMEYNDALLRPTKVTTAYGTPLAAETVTEYGAGTSEATRWVKVKTQIDAVNWKEAVSWFDGLGRNVVSQSVDNEQDDIFVATCYDTMGRVAKTSNPVRAASAPTCSSSLEWTTPAYDDLGRTVSVTTPDSAVVSTAYGLATSGSQIGTAVTVTDQAGKLRRSITNGIGQLTRVDEPNSNNQLGSIASPYQPTYYYYNTQGKMVRVNQGVQDRYFMHDPLGRLIRVSQPEQEVNTALNTAGNPGNNSWTAGFTYDANGNILTTTDANNVTITSAYDALNRQYERSYSDSTPTVSYIYDDPQVANSKGRLTKIYSTVSETRYTEYNEVGKIKSSEQRTDGEVYPSEYTYNLAGMLVEQTYPSGRVVKSNTDNNGDISMIQSKRNENFGFHNYAKHFTYNAAGAMTSMQLGNGLWETVEFNSRLQATQLGLGTLPTGANLWRVDYEFGELQTNGTVDAVKNSGNIARQTLTVPGTSFVQSYKYDSVYRLTEAVEKTGSTQNWSQQFGYDRYGNRTSFAQDIGGITKNTTPAVDANTNRFTSTDFAYDANGNIVEDIDEMTALPREFIFNGDNKQTEVKRNGVTIGRYYYDGEGKRVKKVTDTEITVFVYAAGQLIAEYSTAISQTPSVSYTTTDHLGSPRVITNELGQVSSRRDFMPFGEDLHAGIGNRTGDAGLKYSSSDDDIRQKFTGYEKDNETNLDFAEARMYQNLHGRFTAVDPLLFSGRVRAPQTWNRYTYVLNNPLNLVDPSGLMDCPPGEECWIDEDGTERTDDEPIRVGSACGDAPCSDSATTGADTTPVTNTVGDPSRELVNSVNKTPIFQVARILHKIFSPDAVSISAQLPIVPWGGTLTITSDLEVIASPDAGRDYGSFRTGGISGGFTWITDTDAGTVPEFRTKFFLDNSVSGGVCFQACIGGTLVPNEVGNRTGVFVGYSPTPSASLKFGHGLQITNFTRRPDDD